MTVNARNGFGSVLALSSVGGSTGTFTNVAALLTIGDISKSRETKDVTPLDSTDGYDQVIPGGFTKTDPIDFTGIYLSTNSQHTGIIPDALDNGTKTGWKVVMAGTSSNNVWYGDCYITRYKVGIPFDDKITFSATMKPTGKPLGPLSSTT